MIFDVLVVPTVSIIKARAYRRQWQPSGDASNSDDIRSWCLWWSSLAQMTCGISSSGWMLMANSWSMLSSLAAYWDPTTDMASALVYNYWWVLSKIFPQNLLKWSRHLDHPWPLELIIGVPQTWQCYLQGWSWPAGCWYPISAPGMTSYVAFCGKKIWQ